MIFMVQLNEEEYLKLKKDADDNKQIIRIARYIVAFLIFVVLCITIGTKVVDLFYQHFNAELQTNIAITQAEANKHIMEIESSGMTKEEYFRWLEVRNN